MGKSAQNIEIHPSTKAFKGPYIKYDSNLGGRGVGELQSVIVTVMSCYLVTMTSFCSQRGEGGQKRPKNCGHT